MSGVELLPVESLSLAVAHAQVLRGEDPSPGVATVCVLALARLDGRHDWTADYPTDCPDCGEPDTEAHDCRPCDDCGEACDTAALIDVAERDPMTGPGVQICPECAGEMAP